jgi:nucleoside transporter
MKPLPLGLNVRLSTMMFLQYAIWGAWLPLFWQFLTKHHGISDLHAGYLFSIGGIGALFAPFIAGQIADRWFRTERFLGISHLLGAVLIWQLANVTTFSGFVIFGLLYSLIYAPTLGLTNSLAFHHLPDRDRDFGRVRVWGTVGWIVVGIGMGQWLYHHYTPDMVVGGMADSFRLSAILGAALGVYCFTLPTTPPQPGRFKFAPAEALIEVKRMPLLPLFLISLPIAVVHQFYFAHTAGFLASIQHPATETINKIFGVGGVGLMTIGQMAEILVLAAMPFLAKKLHRKVLLLVGLLAYTARFAVFAYLPTPAFVIPALALHGLIFGCYFFVCFMIVDEHTSADVKASAQGLFTLIIFGIGPIVGNFFAGIVSNHAKGSYETLFMIPMWICVACFFALLFTYPSKPRLVAAPAGRAA